MNPSFDYRTRRAMIIIFLFSALISLFMAGFTAYQTSTFLKTAVRADGIVTEMAEVSGDSGVTYAPVYSFFDAKGIKHSGRSNHSSNPPGFQVGDKLPILYDPQDPSSSRPDAFGSLWFMSLVCGVIGLINLPLGLGFLFWPKIQQMMHRRSEAGLE
ncbi:MAG: hypothetical protein RL095_1894 [Verrucomicrobiota bacterium]